MSIVDADRTLVAGLLALRHAFAGRDEVTRALVTWTAEKHRPLGEILQEQGSITFDDRTLLEGLADRQCKLHRGDPSKTFGDLSAGDLALMTRLDPDLTESLGRFGAPWPTRRGDDSATLPDGPRLDRVMPGIAPWPSSRYRIVRFHARGGLGQVSVALDLELDRHVALKEIQDRHADHPVSRARFLLEAEITGKLEHPGIVPIYGRGESEDGRPYYAMRFIEGESLKEAIDRFHAETPARLGPEPRRLRFRELLERFLDACDALAYAHDRGVVHRDVKPANIMLGPFGETLVVDWGLAKPSDAPELEGGRPRVEVSSGLEFDPTLIGQAIGSPGFMSPEQASGAVDQIGPASDIFNLGATLYSLLTGHVPYEADDLSELLEKAKAAEIIPPRVRDASISPALEAICLKAMALEPSGRYPTALALAADLRRWRADEPVSAFREGVATRIARWARRHRTPVAVSAALLVATVIALALGLWQVGLAKQAADRNALLARSRFALALEAFRTLVVDLQDQLKGRPGTQGVRDTLLRSAFQGVEKLVNQPGDLDDSAEANHLMCLARIQAGDLALQLGKVDVAHDQFLLARQIGERMSLLDSGDHRAGRDRSIALNRLGDLALNAGREDEARDLYRAAEGLIRSSLADPNDRQTKRDAWVARIKMGDALMVRGDWDGALEEYRRCVELTRVLVADRVEPARSHADLVVSIIKVGDVWKALQDLSKAEATYGEALKEVNALIDLGPRDKIPGRRLLSLILDNQGDLALIRGQDEAALGLYDRSLTLAESMHRDDPADARFRRNLSIAYKKRGNARYLLQDAGAAVEDYRRALEEAEAYLTIDPSDPMNRQDVAVAAIRLGDARVALGEFDLARRSFRRALELREGLLASKPTSVRARLDLFLAQFSFEELEFEDFRPSEAIRWGEQALAILRRLEEEGRWPKGQGFEESRDLIRARVELSRLADPEKFNPARLAGQPLADRVRLLAPSVVAFGRSGRPDLAVASGEALAEVAASGDAGSATVAAGALARVAASLPSGPTRERVAGRAIGLLERARSAGGFASPSRRSWLDRAEALAALRGSPSYRDLRLDAAFPANPFDR